jgi:hypothetical protein
MFSCSGCPAPITRRLQWPPGVIDQEGQDRERAPTTRRRRVWQRRCPLPGPRDRGVGRPHARAVGVGPGRRRTASHTAGACPPPQQIALCLVTPTFDEDDFGDEEIPRIGHTEVPVRVTEVLGLVLSEELVAILVESTEVVDERSGHRRRSRPCPARYGPREGESLLEAPFGSFLM